MTQLTSQKCNFAISHKKCDLTTDVLSLGVYAPGPQVLTYGLKILRRVRICIPFRVPVPERRDKKVPVFVRASVALSAPCGMRVRHPLVFSVIFCCRPHTRSPSKRETKQKSIPLLERRISLKDTMARAMIILSQNNSNFDAN